MVAEKIDQCMKPHGEEGIQTIKNMNENHKSISEFAFNCIDVNNDDRILDIGCGGGVNIEKFLKITKNNVDGLDYSEVSVAESTKRNQKAIDDERCEIFPLPAEIDLRKGVNLLNLATAELLESIAARVEWAVLC